MVQRAAWQPYSHVHFIVILPRPSETSSHQVAPPGALRANNVYAISLNNYAKSSMAGRELSSLNEATTFTHPLATSGTESSDLDERDCLQPPRYTINLSLPPKDRYKEVALAFNDRVQVCPVPPTAH